MLRIMVISEGFAANSGVAAVVGYARCSADPADRHAQRQALLRLGIAPERIFLDRGLVGPDRGRPELERALALLGPGDTLMCPTLERLARSVADAAAIGARLRSIGAGLSLGGLRHDPVEPEGELFFALLDTMADFERQLIRLRTREGIALARTKGRLRGKPAKLATHQQDRVVELYRANQHSVVELARMFHVSRPTIYRVLERRGIGRGG
jgi:DNA invertase Pin-like site-specific DNA recombinase